MSMPSARRRLGARSDARARRACAPKPRSSPTPVATGAGRPRRRRSSRSTARAASARASRSPTSRYMMAQQGKKVLLIGCDPEERHDLAAVRRPRLPDDHRDVRRRRSSPARRCRSATSASSATACSRWSSAAPKSAAAAAGAASSTASRLLEKLGFHEWGFDYVLLDFLGDVVCGGFGLPIARDMCQKVIVVGSNDLQSLYVANNVCSAVEYFRKLGGNVGVAGMVDQQGRRHRRGAAFADARRHPGAGRDPRQRGHPPQERELRDHRPPRHRSGRRCSRSSRRTSPTRRRCARRR